MPVNVRIRDTDGNRLHIKKDCPRRFLFVARPPVTTKFYNIVARLAGILLSVSSECRHDPASFDRHGLPGEDFPDGNAVNLFILARAAIAGDREAGVRGVARNAALLDILEKMFEVVSQITEAFHLDVMILNDRRA